jgi:uncharacterized membrane protein YecN with MAPEG domain
MPEMSVELRYLMYTALLLALIWVPYILAQIGQIGLVPALSYTREEEMPSWARRLKRAHYNLVENIPIFAIAVLGGEIQNVHTAVTASCAVIFFWARVAHPIAMVSRVWGTRTIAFAIAWAAAVVHLFAVLTAPT